MEHLQISGLIQLLVWNPLM